MNGLKKAEIDMNRKMLADIALNSPEEFKVLVDASKAALK
jgi:large subunit ribosomal protein L20